MRSWRTTGPRAARGPRTWPARSGPPPRSARRTSSSSYPDDASLISKIETIATKVYGADGIDLLPVAAKQLAQYEALGFGTLPICMAKSQYSLSHDAALKGRPTGFRVPIREVRLSAGAGFITPLAGEMRTMPGLPSRPGGENIDIDAAGEHRGPVLVGSFQRRE